MYKCYAVWQTNSDKRSFVIDVVHQLRVFVKFCLILIMFTFVYVSCLLLKLKLFFKIAMFYYPIWVCQHVIIVKLHDNIIY